MKLTSNKANMTILHVLMLTLVLIIGNSCEPFFFHRHLRGPKPHTVFSVKAQPPYPETGHMLAPQHPCPKFCVCQVTVGAITVKQCTKDPSDVLSPLLEFHPNITTLKIIKSRLSKLPTRVCQLTYLTTLVLQNNQLKTLPWECLKQLQHLHYIDASNNLLERIENGSLYNIHMQQLILHHNLISEIGVDVFTQQKWLKDLTMIDLGWNRLESIDPWPLMFTGKKRVILLNNNQISHFTNFIRWTFKCTPIHPSAAIDLTTNKITHIIPLVCKWNFKTEMDVLCAFSGKSKIDIRYNKFVCDCIDFDAYKLIRLVHTSVYAENLFCDKPERFHGQKIIALPLNEITCNVTKNCPHLCYCIDQPSNLNMSIFSENSKINDMPEKLPKLPKYHYRYYLKFIGTKISNLNYRDYFNQTRYALFTGNTISNISLDALNALSNAEIVALDHNKLKYLPTDISTVNMTTVRDLYLANNEWACDCHAKETQRWLIRTQHVISDKAGILCHTPTRLLGSNLLLLSENDLICGNPPNKVLIATLAAVGATVGACLLFILLPFMFVSIKRVWFYTKFQWHPFDSDECEGENKEFDIFVSYANENSEYVERDLIPKLQYKGYKIAFHRIHFHAGKPIYVSIEECVLKSKRTLIVFSKEFLRSQWCVWEFTVALEQDHNLGTHRLLAIKYEDIQVGCLDLSLQAYFKHYSYVVPNSSTFWDNLQYVLPMKKLGMEDYVPYDIMRDHPVEVGDVTQSANHDESPTLEDAIISDENTSLLHLHD